MFIVHGAWYRRNIRWLLAIVLLLLIPSFIALYTRTDTSRGRAQKLPTIGGATVNPTEYERARNVVMAEMMLNAGGKVPHTTDLEKMLDQESVLRILLLRQAQALGITAGDEEVVNFIQHQPSFRNSQGQFDRERYLRFAAQLPNSRITESQFEEIMRQQLLLQRLEQLVTTAAKVTPLEVRNTFNALNERVTIDYVVLDAADYKEPIQVTDDEVAAFYEPNKETYRQPRQVKVQYFHVPLGVAGQQVSDNDVRVFFERSAGRFGTNSLASVQATIRQELAHSRALAQAGDRATELTVKLVPEPGKPAASLAQVAADLKLAVKETGFFGPGDKLPGIQAGTAFNQAALTLTKESPISDPIEGEDGFYVLSLAGDKKSAIPPLAEVREKVVADLKQQRALEATVKRGEEWAVKAKALVAQGKSFAEACGSFKLSVKTSEPFNLTDKTEHLPAGVPVKERALGLRVGEVSDFLRTGTGGLFFRVQDRTQPTAEEFEKQRERLTQLLLRQSREAIWQAWLQDLARRERVSL